LDRCSLIGGDLSDSVPAGADVYVVKSVLHGYKDDGAVKVLKNCRAVIPDGGTLLIIEVLLPDVVGEADPGIEARMMSDLNMMAVTGGRERSSAEWGKLLRSAGFELGRVIPAGILSIIEARAEAG
jgi:O-methyltransferase domain